MLIRGEKYDLCQVLRRHATVLNSLRGHNILRRTFPTGNIKSPATVYISQEHASSEGFTLTCSENIIMVVCQIRAEQMLFASNFVGTNNSGLTVRYQPAPCLVFFSYLLLLFASATIRANQQQLSFNFIFFSIFCLDATSFP